MTVELLDVTIVATRDRYAYVAKRACGKVSAMCWDDPGSEKSTAEAVARYEKRGDRVERIMINKGEPMPEFICEPGCQRCVETVKA